MEERPVRNRKIGVKFYRRYLIEVEVLSEQPMEFSSLADIHYEITEGSCSGEWKTRLIEEVTPKRMAKLLMAQGSDPSFFQLDEKGRDIA